MNDANEPLSGSDFEGGFFVKHKTSKLLSILLALVMLAGLLPTAALAAPGDVAIDATNFPNANFARLLRFMTATATAI